MEGAYDRERHCDVDARLLPNFAIEVVGARREDGSYPYGCRVCDKDVVGKGGRTTGVRAHFAHLAGTACGYGSSPESEEHRRLKISIAHCVARRPGWGVELEVTRKIARADVLASRFDMDAVYASHPEPGCDRVVVFEAQHSRQTEHETHRRTQRYHDMGFEVVWIFDHRTQLDLHPAVRVERAAGSSDWKVTDGLWPPAGDTGMTLCAFVEAVLERTISHERLACFPSSSPRITELRPSPAFPSPLILDLARRRSGSVAGSIGGPGLPSAPTGPSRAWVLAAHRDVLEIRRDRADATSRILEQLSEAGVAGRLVHPGDRQGAYAAIIETPRGCVAVHPRPSQAQESAVIEYLAESAAVIARDEADRVALVGALGPGQGSVLLAGELNPYSLAARVPVPASQAVIGPSAPVAPARLAATQPARVPRRNRGELVSRLWRWVRRK